jgi:hypothetical protein
MKKKYEITEEEFNAIKEAITETLQLWQHDCIEANTESGRSISMSKETFFRQLKGEFIIK